MHVYGEAQVVGPVNPMPPHCAQCAAPVPDPLDPVEVGGATVLVTGGGATLVGAELPDGADA